MSLIRRNRYAAPRRPFTMHPDISSIPKRETTEDDIRFLAENIAEYLQAMISELQRIAQRPGKASERVIQSLPDVHKDVQAVHDKFLSAV